jgi:hypothetical protein
MRNRPRRILAPRVSVQWRTIAAARAIVPRPVITRTVARLVIRIVPRVIRIVLRRSEPTAAGHRQIRPRLRTKRSAVRRHRPDPLLLQTSRFRRSQALRRVPRNCERLAWTPRVLRRPTDPWQGSEAARITQPMRMVQQPVRPRRRYVPRDPADTRTRRETGFGQLQDS